MTKRSQRERRARQRKPATTKNGPAPLARVRSAWMVHRRELRFMLIFLGCSGLLSLVYAFPYEHDGAVHAGFVSYLAAYARAAGGLLAPFDPSVHVQGATIFGRFSMQIVKDCDAMEVNI